MQSFLDRLENEVLVSDGAMGTMLLEKASHPECLDYWNLKYPELVLSVLQGYAEAGADILTTNTFGANRFKLSQHNLQHQVEEINQKAVSLARQAAQGSYVAADVGPLGDYIQPLGSLEFDQAVDIFREQLQALSPQADLVTIETMSDIMEVRAAVIAAKETNLPVIAQMSIENSRTAVGTDVKSIASVLEGLGVDVLGLNCSLGPREMLPLVKQLVKYSRIPVIVQPNAGMPEVIAGKTCFRGTPKLVADYAKRFVKLGVNLVGGCCGTTPEHMQQVAQAVRGQKPVTRKQHHSTFISSRLKTVEINRTPILVGERINPAHREDIIQELKQGQTDIIRKEAVEQVRNRAEALDINVAAPGIDEKEALPRIIDTIQKAVDVPLFIDTADLSALEEALKVCSGKPVINSTTAHPGKMKKVFSLARKYGAAVVGVAVDEKGVAKTRQEKVKLARRIIGFGKEYIPQRDIIIDPVALTISTDQKHASETLRAIPEIKQLGVRTVLGISNVSHGLPNRSLINSTFLNHALQQGLDLAIANPVDRNITKSFDTSSLVLGHDLNAEKYIKLHADHVESKQKLEQIPIEKRLYYSVLNGDASHILNLVEQALKKYSPLQINHILLKGMQEVGHRFKKKQFFLPQVIMAAKTLKIAFGRLRKDIRRKEGQSRGKVLFATIQHDVHDIGKNIVIALLESYNYQVIDLGVDVPPEKIVQEAQKNQVSLICLSSLMTTTMGGMSQVVDLLKKSNLNIPVMVGGAVVNEEFAKGIGAEYSRDAVRAITKVKEILSWKEVGSFG